jgi:Holliday junction DNA helicase RuvB
MIHRMEYYTEDELSQIIMQSASALNISVGRDCALEMAKRSRGTPRLANRTLKRVRDYAQVRNKGQVTMDIVNEALSLIEVDDKGLDRTDHEILSAMIDKFSGGPVGLDTLAAAIGEDTGTIEDVYEPYLIKCGLINRTPRGRIVTECGYEQMGLKCS